MRNMTTIEYYSAEDCPRSNPEEIEALERQLRGLFDGLRIFSDASAGKKTSIRELKRVLRRIRGKMKRKI